MAGNTPTLEHTDERVNPKLATAEVMQAQVVNPRSGRLKTMLALLLVALDIGMLGVAFAFGYLAREILPFFQPDVQPPFVQYIPTMVLHMVTVVIIFYFSRMYHLPRVFSRFDQVRSIIGLVILGAFLANGIQEFVFRNTALAVNYPRTMFFYVTTISVLLVITGRELHQIVKTQLRLRHAASDNLLIIGSGRIAREILNKIKNQPELGYNMVGVITSKDEHQGRMLGVPVVGNFEDIPNVIDMLHVEQVIIALPDAQRNEMVELVTLCQRGKVDIKIFPDLFAYMAGDLNVDDLGGTPLLTVRDIALRGWKMSLKRTMDVLGAGAGLVMLSPFLLLTSIIIYLQDRGPVFYTQERIGLDGRAFPMIKFRSMRTDAEAYGPGWTVKDDPRVTPIGRFMRRTSWDEIPQLINVLLGHMSLVGPRPEREVYVQEFRKQIPRYMERHREMVGMTGWAQVHGLRGDTSIEQRTAYDLWYVENWSVWLDIKILIRTVWQTLSGKDENAY